MATHYEVLGVARDASAAEIRRGFHHAARQHHPDLHQGEGTAMAAVNAAWAVLSDPARRRAYDNEIGAATTPPVAPTVVAPDPEDRDDQPAWAMQPDIDPRPLGLGSQAVVLFPAGLLAFAVAVFALSTVMGSGGLMLVAVVLVPVAGASFVAAPLLMIRNRRPRASRGKARGSR